SRAAEESTPGVRGQSRARAEVVRRYGGSPARLARGRRLPDGSHRRRLGSRRSDLGSRPPRIGRRPLRIGGSPRRIGTRRPQIGGRQRKIGCHSRPIGSRPNEIGGPRRPIGSHRREIGRHPPPVGSHPTEIGTPSRPDGSQSPPDLLQAASERSEAKSGAFHPSIEKRYSSAAAPQRRFRVLRSASSSHRAAPSPFPRRAGGIISTPRTLPAVFGRGSLGGLGISETPLIRFLALRGSILH